MSRSPRRAALRAVTVLGVAVGTALLAATPALAHVTANSTDAQQGGYAVVQMRVPNESDTAGTIKLETTIPTDHPVTSDPTAATVPLHSIPITSEAPGGGG